MRERDEQKKRGIQESENTRRIQKFHKTTNSILKETNYICLRNRIKMKMKMATEKGLLKLRMTPRI